MITAVIEHDEVNDFLKIRGLAERYKKAKTYLLDGHMSAVNFKKRMPLSRDVWSLRVTKKYRAFCYLKGTTLVVSEINDHQEN